MSAPKRGMVAGQAIVSGPMSKEFDEGFERIFGTPSKERGRFVWSQEAGRMVRIGEDWTDAPRRAPTATEELVYGGMRTASGDDISSRAKHREHLKATGSTLLSDYSDEWRAKRKASAEREQDKQRRADLVESIRERKRY